MTTGKALALGVGRVMWVVLLVLVVPSFWSAGPRAAEPPVAPATPAPAAPAPEAPAPAPAAPDSEAPTAAEVADADAVLRRVLRSGCLEGIRDVRALAGDEAAPWAETVSRLCGEILRSRAPEEEAATPPTASARAARREAASAQEGRGRLVFWSSLYGLWLGIAADVLFDVDSDRTLILPPLIGMGLGMGLSLSLTSGVPITTGQAWTIITGLDYGTINGALWAGSFDASSKGVVGTAVASGIAATTIGLAVADATHPNAGDIEVVRSGLLWGAIGGSLALVAFGPDSGVSETAALRSIALSMDAGFLVGLALAKNFDVSRNRVLIVDAGALGGAVTGLAIAWLARAGEQPEQALAGGALVGMLTGIGIAAIATKDLDANADPTAMGGARSTVPALLARDVDGRWRPGTPGPLPVFDVTGHRLVGATVNAIAGRF